MRGKDFYKRRLRDVLGITPAYAGKRNPSTTEQQRGRDHPRICGEKLVPPRMFFGLTGSPPHMRGKEERRKPGKDPARITPAYAGKSHFLRFVCRCCWDHPRICGEKFALVTAIVRSMGSPPHMRGKGKSLRDDLQRMGITPAYAGKRVSEFGKLAATGDHPRICGEKQKSGCPLKSVSGSPPHMRGKDAGFNQVPD